MTHGPMVSRAVLAHTLANLRTTTELTQTAVAKALDVGPSYISHVESGRTIPSAPTVTLLADLYQANDQLDHLRSLRVAATKPGWWAGTNAPPGLVDYLRWELEATTISRYDTELIPELLRTMDYARVVGAPAGVGVGEYLTALLTRQQRVIRGEVTLRGVLSEAALLRAVYTPGGVAQLVYLLDLIRMGAVVRVVPFTHHPQRWSGCPFTILGFPPDTVPGMCYPDQVGAPPTLAARDLTPVFDEIWDHAVGGADAVDIITEHVDGAREVTAHTPPPRHHVVCDPGVVDPATRVTS